MYDDLKDIWEFEHYLGVINSREEEGVANLSVARSAGRLGGAFREDCDQ